MDATIVSAALFVVVLLLSIVVYDGIIQHRRQSKANHQKEVPQQEANTETKQENTPTKDKLKPKKLTWRIQETAQSIRKIKMPLSGIFKRMQTMRQSIENSEGIGGEAIMDEVSTPVDAQENDKPTDTEQNASVASEPEVLRNEESDTKADAITEAPVNAEPSSPSPDPVADLLGRLAKGQANLGVNSTPPPQSPAPQEVPTPMAGNSTKSDVQAGPSMEMVNALQRTVESLSNRLSQTEDSIARIDQLEEGLAKAVEETEMVSEEMKDILGTLRISIEGLETRLNQVDTGTSEGEDGNEKIEQLEETIASMKDTIDTLKPMTDDVRKAIDSSTEINKRMDVISGNLQATMGYGIQKAFRCDSCGTGGYVTTQVVCSNCGTESWWGWWPQSEGTVQPKSDMTETANTNLASEVESTLNDAR